MYGKAIELFLVNGSADSLTTAELSNWNGKAIKIGGRMEVKVRKSVFAHAMRRHYS